MSSYCPIEGISAFHYGGNVPMISVISSHSEEPVANFNIANLYKNADTFLPNKKACPDLNLQAIDLKFEQIVAFYKAYHL